MPRRANILEQRIKEILVKNEIDLPVTQVFNDKGMPMYLMGPKRHACCLQDEEVMVLSNYGGHQPLKQFLVKN